MLFNLIFHTEQYFILTQIKDTHKEKALEN